MLRIGNDARIVGLFLKMKIDFSIMKINWSIMKVTDGYIEDEYEHNEGY